MHNEESIMHSKVDSLMFIVYSQLNKFKVKSGALDAIL